MTPKTVQDRLRIGKRSVFLCRQTSTSVAFSFSLSLSCCRAESGAPSSTALRLIRIAFMKQTTA